MQAAKAANQEQEGTEDQEERLCIVEGWGPAIGILFEKDPIAPSV